MTEVKTKKIEPKELDLETGQKEESLSDLDLEIKRIQSPQLEEEAKKRLHDISEKIEELAKESQIKFKDMMKEAKYEKGMINKFAVFVRGIRDKLMSDGTTAYSSITFLTGTIKALEDYHQQIPIHIQEFQSAIQTLKNKKVEIITEIKKNKSLLIVETKELKQIRKQVEKEKNAEKKEILIAKEQEKTDRVQNIEIRGNKSISKLQNLNNTTRMFLSMKGHYEILLKQVGNLLENLKEHKKVLEIVGPSVAEVQKVVLTIDKFTNTIEGYRQRDNETIKLVGKATKEITPAIRSLERPWYKKGTVEELEKDREESLKTYKKHFGTDITKLEEYDVHKMMEKLKKLEAKGESNEQVS